MSSTILIRLLSNATKAETRLIDLKKELTELKKIKIEEAIKFFLQENGELATKVENTKQELIRLEILNNKKQYPVPGKSDVSSKVGSNQHVDTVEDDKNITQLKDKTTKPKKEKAPPKAAAPEENIDVRRLDFRIGKIIDVNKHPDADSLYVEKIDCGEESARTVVSGLVNHVPIDQMRDRMVMVLCNLKPVKMRGVVSEAMVMCASTPEKVEILTPPAGSVPGDLVTCSGHPREPDVQLNPKKKVFETCAPDLKTDEHGVACYKGSPLQVPGKGNVVAPSLKGVNVK